MKRVGLIALDMDGTLLASDHYTVPQRNIDAIREAVSQRVHVCICTGRMLEDASEFCRRLGLPCEIISCNGTRVASGALPEGEIIFRRSFSPEDAQAALDILMPTGLMINVFEDGLVSTRQSEAKEIYHLVRRGVIPAVYGEENVRTAAARGVMKIFTVDKHADKARLAHVMEQLRVRFASEQITCSADDNIELVPPDAGKGTALAALAAHLGLTSENVMAVGDANNDISMLRYAFHSVAMGNAEEHVKRICRYETLANDACGVAHIIEQVLSAKRADG